MVEQVPLHIKEGSVYDLEVIMGHCWVDLRINANDMNFWWNSSIGTALRNLARLQALMWRPLTVAGSNAACLATFTEPACPG